MKFPLDNIFATNLAISLEGMHINRKQPSSNCMLMDITKGYIHQPKDVLDFERSLTVIIEKYNYTNSLSNIVNVSIPEAKPSKRFTWVQS